jgi:sodium/proline symporter
MAIKIAILVVYLVGLAAIGLVASRRVKDISDFFVGGKKLGFWLVSFSSRATGESGWLLLGFTGMGYAIGVQAFWVVMGEMFGVTLCWVLLTQRFKALTDRYDSITIPDYLESRFGEVGHALRAISALVLAVFVTAYVSAQFTAAGKAFVGFLGVPYHWGVVIGLVIVAFYSIAGGFVAVAWSDLVQGILMLVGLVVTPIVALAVIGGFGPLADGLAAADPALLTIFGADGATPRAIVGAFGMFAIGWGFLGSPQLFVRFIAIKSTKELAKGSVVAVLYTCLADVGAVLTGMCGRVLLGGLEDKEQVLPELANSVMPTLAVGLLIAIVLAAIMSTADSLLVLAASALVRDLWQKILRPEATDQSLTRLSRIVTLVISVVALGFALTEARVIFWFVLFAWAGIASAFCPVIVLSLFWSRLTRPAAMAAMITGFAVTIGWKLMPPAWLGLSGLIPILAPPDKPIHELVCADLVYEMIPAFLTASAVAVVISLLTQQPANAARDLSAIKDEVVDLWR